MASKQLFTALLNYGLSFPADLKSLPNVNLFKLKIKHWKCTECPCKLYKTYLKIKITFIVSSKSIKPCNKVMRKASTFICKFFSDRLFYMLYFKLVSGVHFRSARRHLRFTKSELLQK